MEIFNLTAEVTISVYTKVEANTLEEAIKIAENRSIERSDFRDDNAYDSWVSDEYDGEVMNISQDED